MKKRYGFILLIGLVCVILDQATKFWIVSTLPLHARVEVLPGFFNLVHVLNRGAAFGFLNSPDIDWQFWLFMAATLLSYFIVFFLARSSPHDPVLFTGFGLILGGATGNAIDRITTRAVVDFLDFHIGVWHWPAFNIADIAICCGAVLTIFAIWQSGKKALHLQTKPKTDSHNSAGGSRGPL